MKLTIITPSFNQVSFIEQTIDSVLSQNYSKLEYIIIDGGSSDGSVDIIKRYSRYLTFWVSESDHGQSHAINKGLQKASGEIVNWLNSDDYMQPGSLKALAEKFQDPLINVVCGRSNVVQEGKIIRKTTGTDIYDGNLPKTIGWARIDQPETYFRKRVYHTLGLLNEDFHFVMDKEFWVRYLFKYGLNGVLTIPDILVNFRIHDKSKTWLLQEAFNAETNGLFYQLALQHGLTDEASIIEEIGKLSAVKLKFSSKYDQELMRSVLHYFLLYKADESYAGNDSVNARKILDSVSPSFIDLHDKPYLRKLKFRSNLPQSLISLIRKWR